MNYPMKKNFCSSSIWLIKTFNNLGGIYYAFALSRFLLPESALKLFLSSGVHWNALIVLSHLATDQWLPSYLYILFPVSLFL